MAGTKKDVEACSERQRVREAAERRREINRARAGAFGFLLIFGLSATLVAVTLYGLGHKLAAAPAPREVCAAALVRAENATRCWVSECDPTYRGACPFVDCYRWAGNRSGLCCGDHVCRTGKEVHPGPCGAWEGPGSQLWCMVECRPVPVYTYRYSPENAGAGEGYTREWWCNPGKGCDPGSAQDVAGGLYRAGSPRYCEEAPAPDSKTWGYYLFYLAYGIAVGSWAFRKARARLAGATAPEPAA